MHMCICSNELFYQAACDGLSTHRVALKTLKKGQILGHVFGQEAGDQIQNTGGGAEKEEHNREYRYRFIDKSGGRNLKKILLELSFSL